MLNKRLLIVFFVSSFLATCTGKYKAQDVFTYLPQNVNRPWIGPAFWANPMMDWRWQNNRVECFRDGRNHDLHLLTHQMKPGEGNLSLSAKLGMDTTSAGHAFMGFKIAITGHDATDYLANLFRSEGIRLGVMPSGELIIDTLVSNQKVPASDLANFGLNLFVDYKNDTADCLLQATDSDGNVLAALNSRIFRKELIGNIALACEQISKGKKGNITGWFKNWQVDGTKLAVNLEHEIGPVLWTQYTVNEQKLKLLSHFVPLDSAKHVAQLQIQKNGKWQTLQEQAIDPVSCTALFEVADWDINRDIIFRVHIDLKEESSYWQGTIRQSPTNPDTVSLAVMSCLGDAAFPNKDLVVTLEKHAPDVMYFAGDQIYEPNGGFGTVPNSEPEDIPRATLNYLQKWWIWGLTFRDLLKNRPAIITTDDHDVYSNDLWGKGGELMQGLRTTGGYSGHPQWINMVEHTQMGHMPASPDTTPVKNGINVHYTQVKYAGLSLAVLEDRKWKSAPAEVLDQPIGHDNFNNLESITSDDFNPQKLDNSQLNLLGQRQLDFLESWVEDWQATDFKAVLSASPFTNCHHGYGNMVADLDGNGWPQSGRNEALSIIRKGFAVTLHGDLHLTTLFQNGIENYGDAAWTYSGPAANAVSLRVWKPDQPGKNRKPGQPPHLGDFRDGLDNKFTMQAVVNPDDEFIKNYRKQDGSILDNHKLAGSGFGLVHFNRPDLTITFESWPIYDAETPIEQHQPHPGWPHTIAMAENYGREAVAWLPHFTVEGVAKPVVKVYSLPEKALVYARRMNRQEFNLPVFSMGNYRIEMGEPGTQKWKIMNGLEAGFKGRTNLKIDF